MCMEAFPASLSVLHMYAVPKDSRRGHWITLEPKFQVVCKLPCCCRESLQLHLPLKYLSVCLSVYPSIRPSVRPFIYLGSHYVVPGTYHVGQASSELRELASVFECWD